MTESMLAKRRNAAIAKGVGVTTQVYVERAENAEIWDVQGQRYIDFAAGIAVVNTGHRHPRVIAAAREQLEKFTHTCHQVVPYENYVALAERLNHLVPGNFVKKTVFVTTGAEAVENAVKIARAATGRSGVVAFSGAFHGRTFLGMSLTGKVVPYKIGFGPLVSDVYRIPFPVELRGISVEQTLNALENLFKTDIEPTRVAAIIIEPIQGEGGFYPAPSELLKSLREIADRYGIVLIADEIQTGFARTGKLFAMEHHGVAADLTTMAKGLAGGLPLAAVTGRSELMDAVVSGGLGGTYGGNPVAIATGHAVLDVIEEEKLATRATQLGERLKQCLHKLRPHVPQIADVRGIGLMIAVEFNRAGSQEPDAVFTNTVRQKALERGLILLTCGIHGNVIRFLPPLTIQNDVFDEALNILESVLLDLSGKKGK
ncbi:diaminobutyrate--2-oxoglutarate transaminase [Xenorhabdus vietnamensis]|uniref:Diaminobutyrate--2-oxoglutarate transaminase n=1 Tax=Xenorhabdus vietnamensis TaxID=351656 RepID=A0A1Y2SCN6_9GAMM|nr:4-aminobutyrate--2-oxoglutarate transaminase [Xenorhabdus vietnamensis]OTA15717.1 diaminobutyrate--2-oxoglutarate transaminase [Xenorhabdus vietnamensis]